MTLFLNLPTPIAQGRTAEIYAWEKNKILKLYFAWCPPDWVEYEAQVARTIVEAGIPTPAVGDILEVNNRRGILYERVAGISMDQDTKAKLWKVFQHARILADLQVQFHQLSIPGLQSYHSSLKQRLQNSPHLPEQLRQQTLEILNSLPDGKALCHADFHPGNVLMTSDGPLVIDWMTAKSGSPWADVARTSLILTVSATTATTGVFALLRPFIRLFHQTYLKRYQALNPDPQGELQRWIPVMAATRLDEQIDLERNELIQIVTNYGSYE